jgi:hypothetical protein
MAIEVPVIEPGSDTDLAIQRALEAANLRATDDVSTSTNAVVMEDRQFSAAEAGDLAGALDGD